MTQQFKRQVSLIVANNSKGIDLSQMHFTFRTEAADVNQPNILRVRVFNLSDGSKGSKDTAHKIKGEFNRVVLQAGYDNIGTIFDGTIKQVRIGRVNPTDTYVDILAADGDLGFTKAVMNKTLAAGSTLGQRIAAVDEELKKHGIDPGYRPNDLDAAGGVLPRGKVMFGMARDAFDDLSATANATWSIQQGKSQLVPLTGYIGQASDAIVLTAKTGMIGLPEQTDNGIRVEALINPAFRIGGLVKIDNKSIQQAEINIDYTAINLLADLSRDGLYRIYVVEHEGDTRGNDWYSHLTCLAVNPAAPPDSAVFPYG